jgi:V/A-type H+-transporting ATPase subunit I
MYFVPSDRAKEVDDIFARLYFERMWVPDFVHGTPQDAIAQIMTEESEVRARQEELNNMSGIASPADITRLLNMTAWLNYQSQIADMCQYVIILERAFYLSGFVPADQVNTVRSALSNLRGVRVCKDSELEDGAEPIPNTKIPVKLKNNWIVRPFEMFVEMYGLPEYGDIDPTPFVAFTYSILFGVMFGDVGQGVLLGLIGYFIMYKKMHMPIGQVLSRCSVFCVLFGFVYGSVFGYEDVLNPLYYAIGFTEKPLELLEPTGIVTVLVASVIGGVFLIVAAMVTGVLSCMRRGQPLRGIVSVNGVAGQVFYLSLLSLLVKYALDVDLPFVGTTLFYALCLAVPFVCMYFAGPICERAAGHPIHESFGEMLMNGFFEIFDALLSFASNTMSFLRVGGFALAHAGMMIMVFTLADMTTNIVAYLLIVVLGNLFVMALEGLFVGIQVLRLEFYEMFSRFFDADGIPFTPLRIKAEGEE